MSIETTLENAVHFLRGMAYGHRLHLLMLLRDGEQTPGALAEAIQLESTLVAHHLRSLRQAGLIRRQRRGRNVYYALASEATGRLVQEILRFAAHPD